jgi:hypothetical protein
MSDDLTPRFFHWMEAHNITRTEAASLLGVDERSLSNYRSRGLPRKKQARALQLMKEMLGGGDTPDTNRIFVNFTDDQLKDLDLSIATWWSRNGGTDFVAYVRFSEVASTKGESLIERVRSGQGLLEPIDRATEQAEEARFALERSFFWTKRVPLFANWLVMALMYDILAVPDLQRVITSLEVISHTAATMPDRVNMVSERVGSVEQTATVLVDRVFRNVLILLITVFLGIYGVILLRRRKAS